MEAFELAGDPTRPEVIPLPQIQDLLTAENGATAWRVGRHKPLVHSVKSTLVFRCWLLQSRPR
jgi:hypothetical protein